MYDKLFICKANIGRSQMAQGLYNHYTQGFNSISAGIIDIRDKVNYKVPQLIIDLMQEIDIDISNQKMNLVQPLLVGICEQVILFCEPKICPNYVKNNDKTLYIPVKDPKPKDTHNPTLEEIAVIRNSRDELRSIIEAMI